LSFELKNKVGITGTNSMKIEFNNYDFIEKVKKLNNENLSNDYNIIIKDHNKEPYHCGLKKSFEEKRNNLREKQQNSQNTVKILQDLLDRRENSVKTQMKIYHKTPKKIDGLSNNLWKSNCNLSKVRNSSINRMNSISHVKQNCLNNSLSPVLTRNFVKNTEGNKVKKSKEIRNTDTSLISVKSKTNFITPLQNRTHSAEYKSRNDSLQCNNNLKKMLLSDLKTDSKDTRIRHYKSRKELIKNEKKKIVSQSKSVSSQQTLGKSFQNNNKNNRGIYKDFLNDAIIQFKEISPSASELSTSNLPEENNIQITSVVKLNNNKELNMDSSFNIVNQNKENYKGQISLVSPKDNNVKECPLKNIEVESIEDMHLYYIKFFQQSKRILSLQESGLNEMSCKGLPDTTVVYLEAEKDLDLNI